jgi:hypothetical protein
MGANLIILASSLLLSTLQHDTTDYSDSPSSGIGYERLSDLIGYNRVQGLSLGLGYQALLPGARSTRGYATLRYGISDERVTGRLSIVQELRRGSLRLSGYYDVADVDPIAPGRTLANTANALLAGHDNGDYVLSRGGSLKWETRVGAGLVLELSYRVERQNSMGQVARSAVNDFLGGSGLFPPNPPVREGTYGAGSVGLSARRKTRWTLTFDVLGGAGWVATRFFGDARRDIGTAPAMTLRLRAGTGTEPGLPQSLFRLGGLNTVRGFEYATRRAPAFWAAQVDLALLTGRVRPVLFLDAGQASRLKDFGSSPALVGAGAGLSILKGLLRFDLSRPVSPDTGGKLRFDLVIQGVR